ncbi:uncharacterized protein CDAR_464021 [Caerostris darwini]|uniref:Uncharacterized protein n=1 Tax=Caerostris darwini TaxID=1538125 RepID=A0AAV4VV73_9ARAC|nr:uncharacterized protein CDAR_464021 [Caerostris darwini]
MLDISGLSDVPMMSTPIRSPRVQEPSDLPGDVSQNLWGVSGSDELFATAPTSPLMQKRPDFLGPITPPPETFNIVGKPGFGHYRLLSPIPSARSPVVQEQYDLMSDMTPLTMSTARSPAFDLLDDSMRSPVAAPRTPVMRERLDLLGDITPRPQNFVVSSTPIRGRSLTPPAATMMSPRMQGRIDLLGDITPPAKRMGILSRGRSRRPTPVAVVKSPVRMRERLEFLDQMSPPPEMLDLSQISSAGGSIATPPVAVVTSPLVQERFSQFSQMLPPAEMLNISGLSSGIGSPVAAVRSPLMKPRFSYLDEMSPPMEMVGSPAVLASPVPVYASPVRQTPGDLLSGITPLSLRSNAAGLPSPMQAYVSPIRSDHSEIMEIPTPLPGEEVSYFEGRGGEIFEIPSPMKPFMFLGSPGSVLGGRSPPPGTRFPYFEGCGGEIFDVPTPLKRTINMHSPSRGARPMNVAVKPQAITRSPDGERVICDLSVEIEQASRAARRPRHIEREKIIVRGTPPVSETVGRRVDRTYGLFTPRSTFRRQHVGVRRPLFRDDYPSSVITRSRTPAIPAVAPQRVPRGSIEWSSPQRRRFFSPHQPFQFKSYPTSAFPQQ